MITRNAVAMTKKKPLYFDRGFKFCCARQSTWQAKYCNLLCSVIQGEYEIWKSTSA